MPTVPTSDALPYAPVSGSLPNVQATAADFGGQVGGAEQKVGADLQQSSNELGDVAMQVKQRQRLIAVNNATNGFLSDTHTVTSGDPNNPNDPGYFGKSGEDAVNGRAGAFSALNTAFQNRMQGLQGDPLAQAQFEQEGRRYLNMTQQAIDSHYEQQSKEALAGSAQATQSVALQGLNIYAADENGWQTHLQTLKQGVNDEASVHGWTQIQTQAAIQQATEQAYAGRVQALVGQGRIDMAQQVLKDNADAFKPATLEALNNIIAPKVRQRDADGIAGNVLNQANSDYQSTSGQAPAGGKVGTITEALAAQETTNGKNNVTSATGAKGLYQIEPDTFASEAMPGEDFNNEQDRENVSRRLIDKYNSDYNGDAARVAVAWYSGPDNVAPAGSPTPWKQDLTPKAGVPGPSVSQYVSQVTSRIDPTLANPSAPPVAPQPGSEATPKPPPMSQADYYRANYDSYVEKARAAAVEKFPDDPVAVDLAVSRVQQQMSAAIRNQDESYKADSDMILRAANGDLVKGTHPQTIQELTAVNPQVAAAWDRVEQQQPEFAHAVATRMLTENAKGPNKDATEYGPAWQSVYKQLYPADGSSPSITPQQIHMMTAQGQLTYAGSKQALAELNNDDGEAAMKTELFKSARKQLSTEDDTGLIKDPQGEQLFQKFMPMAYKAIAEAKAKGVPVEQMYDPDSPNYVGKGIASLKRSDAQHAQDLINANDPNAPTQQTGGFFSHLFGGAAPDLSTPEAVRAAYSSGKIDRATAIKTLSGMAKPAPAPTVPTTMAATE